MDVKTETVEQKLLRTLKELAAPHAISPEGRGAILPLIPLAEQIVRDAAQRDELDQKIRLATQALEVKLDQITAERDHLLTDVESLRAQVDALTREKLGIAPGLPIPANVEAPPNTPPDPAVDLLLKDGGAAPEGAMSDPGPLPWDRGTLGESGKDPKKSRRR